MALSSAIKGYNNISVGLITDVTYLQYPAGASVAEDNMTLTDRGNRARRRGFNFEDNYAIQYVDGALLGEIYLAASCHLWEGAGGDNGKDFLVVQIGSSLHVYDMSISPLSNGYKWSYSFVGKIIQPSPQNYEVGVTSSGGNLYVVNPAITPFMMSYDIEEDSYSVTDLEVEVRDFKGIDGDIDVDEHPEVLEDDHKYNLLNQGWDVTNITAYEAALGDYPANNEIWYFGKGTA